MPDGMGCHLPLKVAETEFSFTAKDLLSCLLHFRLLSLSLSLSSFSVFVLCLRSLSLSVSLRVVL